MEPGPDHSVNVTHDITKLVREHQPLVRRALRRFGVPERDLPDATQDVFVVVHRRLPSFEGRSRLSTWIYRIAFHVASEHRRRACNRHEVMVDVDAPSACTFDPERAERLDHVTRALDTLDPNQRDLWLDFELDEQPMATIAARLQIPLKTAFSRLYAARRDLSRRLRDSGLALVVPRFWPRRTGPSLTWITSLAAVVLLVPELHQVTVQSPQVTPPDATQSVQIAKAVPRMELTQPAQPTDTSIPVRVTRKSRPIEVSSRPVTETHEPEAEDLIVFHDSETTRAPSLPPPLLAELPPAPAAEPRIQLRGRRDADWKLALLR